MVTYTEIETDMNYKFIERTNEDGTKTHIPINEANADYQAYLDRDKPKAALSTPSV